ncbi:MAG: hypothetical protein CVU57_08800 [Deltaproteobacteria bacterium HGW-Deltaproteobacteria-15]|nr:MAG: hypothetical protein CVU57_08800 [Deltaproteobacteria bacterium HGW-Deltaproteobacteria-15]
MFNVEFPMSKGKPKNRRTAECRISKENKESEENRRMSNVEVKRVNYRQGLKAKRRARESPALFFLFLRYSILDIGHSAVLFLPFCPLFCPCSLRD